MKTKFTTARTFACLAVCCALHFATLSSHAAIMNFQGNAHDSTHIR